MPLIFDGEEYHDYEVGTIFCIGRNFVEHAHELGNEPPVEPIIFTKPFNSFRHGSYNLIEYPPITEDLHFEAELVIVLRGGGRSVKPYSVSEVVAGYAIGLDLTMRDVQAKAKKAGLPWTTSKGFDGAAQVSHFIPFESAPAFEDLAFSLYINGELRQRGATTQMIFSPEMLIPYLSKSFYLRPGDLLFTGTPVGTGPLHVGDKIVMHLHTADVNNVLIDFRAEVTEWQE
jgi:2-keto-4-pentenoate hydratase/2-oxohepta-3-ene-1,7-dioic acid hydratase in catechol pathway